MASLIPFTTKQPLGSVTDQAALTCQARKQQAHDCTNMCTESGVQIMMSLQTAIFCSLSREVLRPALTPVNQLMSRLLQTKLVHLLVAEHCYGFNTTTVVVRGSWLEKTDSALQSTDRNSVATIIICCDHHQITVHWHCIMQSLLHFTIV